ncbi:hypothetical protein Taro_002613 [Colocasia esculenta]|uniref:MORF/ORRM1/DAG-like MORF domain-containing protein n=1 Tax=Colocasia esculenta TaxID=4460 RepID=A0A843TJ69_COLES|nr:hypothetical protein [Colocasia esculenta]
MELPEEGKTRDEIIDSYNKTLAQVVGSEEEARIKIYSMSTRHYFAFGALVSEELSYKIKELPRVRWVLPDSYMDVKNKDYGQWERMKQSISDSIKKGTHFSNEVSSLTIKYAKPKWIIPLPSLIQPPPPAGPGFPFDAPSTLRHNQLQEQPI